MNEATSLFQFNTHQVRVIPNGTSFWVVAQDVAEILNFKLATDALKKVPEKHKGMHKVPTPGGVQEMLCVDEPGLYRLVLRSNKPEAEPFIEWVTSEVLPAIRQTGVYAAPTGGDPILALLARLIEGQQATQASIMLLLDKAISLQERTLEVLEALAPKPRSRRVCVFDDVAPVKKMAAEKMSQGEISSLTGIPITTVYCIINDRFDVRPDGRLRMHSPGIQVPQEGGAL